MAGNFKIGDLVWAKMKGFPAWPGKVIAPKIDFKRPACKKNQQFVSFFGSENYAWIPAENIHDFPTHRSRFLLTQRLPRGYKEAIEAVEDALKSNPTESQKMSAFDSSDDEDRDFDSSPLKIDWVDLSSFDCTEPLGITSLPGCRFKDTWRDLKADIALVKSEGVKEVFVLCTRGELHKYRVPLLLREMSNAELTVHHHPFPDGHTPAMTSLAKMLDTIRVNLMQGRKCLIHCYGGLGRSCLVAVCLLLSFDDNKDAEGAIAVMRGLRGPGAVQSVKQYNFIYEFRKNKELFEKDREEAARSVSR